MNIDIIIACLSFGVSLANAAGVAAIYMQYLKTARNVVCTIKATKDGEVVIDDPFLGRL